MGEEKTHHEAGARADDDHGVMAEHAGFGVAAGGEAGALEEDIGNAEAEAGDEEVKQRTADRAALDWKLILAYADVFWQGFVGAEVHLTPLRY